MYSNFTKNNTTNKVILFLLIIDLIFISIDLILKYLSYTDPNISVYDYEELRITTDLSYAEFFQYFKYLVICGITSYLIIIKKNHYYASWLLVFLILFLDDALQLHENLAVFFISAFNLKPTLGLRQQDIGELAYSAFIGSILLITLAVAYIKGRKKFKKTSIDIVLLFGLFLFFGIVIDMVHSFVDYSRSLRYIVGIIEDGGEMIVLSLLTWYFAHINFRKKKSKAYLYKSLYNKKIPFLGI